ncbi:MAG: hypothetical protein OZ921_17080 [Sorangiineae bacterium]|nr:hypothetical protein [Polyangiaceae bacterium]MEB2324230.1 hypothetical protein [Sorangiineae bacterium]
MLSSRIATALFVLALAAATEACGGGADSAPTGSGGAAGAAGAAGGGAGGTSGTGGGAAGSGGAGGTAGAGGAAPTLCSDPDADSDNISDADEGRDDPGGPRDTDGDGTPDYLDADSDGDTIPDLVEAGTRFACSPPLDSDGDGTPNHRDLDSDDNGIPDRDEITPDGQPYDSTVGLSDLDKDGDPDFIDSDNDGDTIGDVDELVNGKPVDTDHDGVPDFNDFDSDADTIGDGYEGIEDADGDGLPNFRDPDSDNDGVPDVCEAGPNHEVKEPPVDTDLDAKYDFLDVDSDNDGLKDGQEDKNGDCVVNIGETDRLLSDTDGDGATDLIEVNLDSDPTNQFDTPQSRGKYYFVMPYRQSPQPAQQDVVLTTNLNKGDIALVVDTTGSMGPAITNIQQNLTALVTDIRKDVPDARFGVLGQDDYPLSPYGVSGQHPVWLPGGNSAFLSDQLSDTLAAVGALTTTGGDDFPESQVTALFRALDNDPILWSGGGSVAPFSLPSGGYGGLGFRDDALAILISVTDASFHNSKYVDKTTLHDAYAPTLGVQPTVDDLVSEMNAHGAKFIGISLDNGGPQRVTKDPYRDMAYISSATRSYVEPSAFPGGGTDCYTDLGGNPIAPDQRDPSLPSGAAPSLCRLIFSGYNSTSPNAGQGVSTTVGSGIKALLRGIKLEVRVAAVTALGPIACDPGSGPVAVDPIDAFLAEDYQDPDTGYIEVNAPGQVEDPAAPGMFCETIDPLTLRDYYSGARGVIGGPPPIDAPDTYNETITGVVPGIRVCFRVVPKMNELCPQKADVQIVTAQLVVYARNEGQAQELVVGQPRDVFFVIPPSYQ